MSIGVPKDDDIGSAATVGSNTDPTSATQPASPPPSLIANRYEVLGLLGMGGMGRVYRAHDRSLDETVALKMLRRELVDTPGMLERFRQEVKLARRVTNTHVVRTFDLGEHDSDHFLTMEYIDGRSLAQLLEDKLLPLHEVLRIARATCAGIAAAHAAGVLHRDLKPDNILVAKTGRIAITDFGIARASADPDSTERFVGTPAYMAPEQVQGTTAIAAPADIYSFGAILFEMLAGRRPFIGRDPVAVAMARLAGPPPDPRTYQGVPDPLAELVLRCLAQDPSKRFLDASALAQALASIADQPAVAVAVQPVIAVPMQISRSVALLPLQATGDLVEIAEGLTEEIVDALTMTRALRVRPLASVRTLARDHRDAREIGRALDVDVVVDGSIRRRGEGVRIVARAIGVTDGFQLWASHFDTAPEGLLNAGDDVARAVARALTVEIEMPTRVAENARAIELYLEGKARMRGSWFDADLAPAIADLEGAVQLAPDHPGILANLAMGLARTAFYGVDTTVRLARARALGERAVAIAPGSGEAWLALGVACLYDAAIPEAARALSRAVERAPGLALAQAMFGAILLEAGAFEQAMTHLEAGVRIDPMGPTTADLPRAYVYDGRTDEAIELLTRFKRRGKSGFADFMIARFRMWRGELTELAPLSHDGLPVQFARDLELTWRIYKTGVFGPQEREEYATMVNGSIPRLRAARSQFMTEFLMFVGDHEAAVESIEVGIAAGLQDYLWIQRCPLLAPLRDMPKFRELQSVLAARADAVLSALRATRAELTASSL